MQSLQIKEILKRINAKETFEAITEDASFKIKIHKYVPYICTAIHNGNNIRKEIQHKIDLDDYERWYEEDPKTGLFIDSLPITIIALDSRYEYDLNRSSNDCIYEEAWGKKVWKKQLTPKQKQTSIQKHNNFYKIVYALVNKLEELFNGCLVYDIHSYNYKRIDRDTPLFNIGAEKINDKYKSFVAAWEQDLSSIEINGIINVSAINDVFYGRGYNLEFISSNFSKTLVLATEIKKVYCNEQTGEYFPEVIRQLQQQFKKVILNNALNYSKEYTNWKPKTISTLLDTKTDPAINKLDKKLFRLLKNFELLAVVNPINSKSEYSKLVKNKFTKQPVFRYAPIKINPYEFKQTISQLRIKDISDISVRNLYEAVVNSYFDKIDLLSTLNSKKFLYNSIRYFGRPSNADIQNAEYILSLPKIPNEPKYEPFLKLKDVIEEFNTALSIYNINSKIEVSNRVISQVLVLNSKNTIQFNPDAKFTQKEVKALIEHEIGVHMVTTHNSINQNLKVFNIGLPVNTKTQEGLAILAEYLSGNISLKRLQKIALRVIITDLMCAGASFLDSLHTLINKYGVNNKDAYVITTRIYRGGGFTKDYLYLSGFVEIFKLWDNNVDLKHLLIGKTSLEFSHTISEMIEREMINKPVYVTSSFVNPNPAIETDTIYKYILSGLK